MIIQRGIPIQSYFGWYPSNECEIHPMIPLLGYQPMVMIINHLWLVGIIITGIIITGIPANGNVRFTQCHKPSHPSITGIIPSHGGFPRTRATVHGQWCPPEVRTAALFEERKLVAHGRYHGLFDGKIPSFSWMTMGIPPVITWKPPYIHVYPIGNPIIIFASETNAVSKLFPVSEISWRCTGLPDWRKIISEHHGKKSWSTGFIGV